MNSKILKSPIPTLPYPKGNVNVVQYLIDKLHSYNLDKQVMIDCPSGRTWTAKNVIFHVLNVAAALKEKGLSKGDVVCFVCPNSDYYAMLLLGVIACGGTFTATSDLCPFREVFNAVEDTGAVYIVTDEANLEVVKSVNEKLHAQIKEIFVIADEYQSNDCKLSSFKSLFNYDRNANANHTQLPMEVSQEDIAALLLSSGSTGRPKPIIRTHRNVINLTAQFQHEEYWGLKETSVHSCQNTFCHSGGMTFLFHTLSSGAKAVIMPGFGKEKFLVYIDKYKITSAFLVPAYVIFLSKCDASAYDVSSFEEIICAGSPLPSGVADKVIANMGLKYFRQGYGMTEVGFCTQVWRSKWKEHINSVGYCVPDSMIKIVDRDSGQLCSPNQIGEVLIKSLQMTPGYFNRPDENEKAFDSEGFLRSGDAGYYEDDLLYIVDRYKQIIKVEGVIVVPAELESLLLNYEPINEAAVIGVKHDYYGHVPKAFVVLKEEYKHVQPNDVVKYIDDLVANHKRLRGGVEIISQLPKTPLGKINKTLLN